jgi:hypothetical protein
MLAKMYGRVRDRESLASILDDVQEDLRRVRAALSREDQQLLAEHEAFVRQLESELQADRSSPARPQPPELEAGIKNTNDNLPSLSRLQIDLLANSFRADMTRVATLQYTNSVGQARMRWIGVEENHHELSHEPDSNATAQEKLTKINRWFCEQLAYLVRRLQETPEPGGTGSLLDNTLIVWTNELGKGNSHTLDNVPFVLVGNAPGFRLGRSLRYPNVPHNRLLLALAHAFDHRLVTFGKPELCGDGVLADLA